MYFPYKVKSRKIRYSLFAIRYSLFAIRYSLFAIRYSLFAIRYSLFAQIASCHSASAAMTPGSSLIREITVSAPASVSRSACDG